MNESVPPRISLEQHRSIDRVADRYEHAFRAGQRVGIEDCLRELPDLREYLLEQLVTLELELRRSDGEQPSLDEYRKRFPEDVSIVEAAFALSDVVESTIDRLENTEVENEEALPERLGRYVIERQLGRGGFGVVYLALDPQLDRPVAIKVPRRGRFKTAVQVARFLEEARTAANLKHPGLVTVYDVQEEYRLPFIVQEYIEGANLRDWSLKQQPTFEQIVRVLMEIAEALSYAHQRGLTHCDLKLANILMDTSGKPHVADFGLSVHESDQSVRRGEIFGTPAMMAPEQVRGEGHRLDGRTDIWAIGVMMYELLVGRRPFAAATQTDLFNEILTLDPKPLRQTDRRIPRELERICLKCMSKNRIDRYITTDDLREDLLAWLGDKSSTQGPHSSSLGKTADSSLWTSYAAPGSKPPARIIPKGLRSFDAEDANFFLDLLPGPRDRDGLPESIRFWKNRIEESDPDKTFSVGLIYGPSGCGKSSLVKAGLLPRLSESVLPIYVEATAADTEVRILKQLRKHIPRLPLEISLAGACAELRLTGAGRHRKFLLVIDQFEQWLHSHGELKQAQMVDALRQCDGGRLQAVLLVRDDFFASVHRFFQELENPLLERSNYALIDTFDLVHASKVLIAFGRAYGKLDDTISNDESQFVRQAVQELTEDGKVISVRLALFADMMKSRQWKPSSLQDVGGVGGVGVTFLEETFNAKTAPPAHRVHEQAIRKVLKALLPEAGTDIKGGMRSEVVLRETAAYQDNPKRFEELTRILDSELRIITPTEPDGGSMGEAGDFAAKFYQLTHDYLVPSLREWLNRKQKETKKGRAELKLEERTSLWNAKRENRHLPNVIEWINIRCFTNSKSWTELQRTIMHKAARVHGTLWGTTFGVLLIAAFAIQQYMTFRDRQIRIESTSVAIDSVQSNRGEAIPRILYQLDSLPRKMANDELRARFVEAKGQQKLSLAYALARYDQDVTEKVVQGIVDKNTQGAECTNIVAALERFKGQALPKIQSAAEAATAEKDWKTKTRLAIVAMYLDDVSIAEEMLRAEESPPNQLWDPVQRTEFIEEFPGWCGELGRLADILRRTDNTGLRSGISLSVGRVAVADDQAKEVWQKVFDQWYANDSDSGTHSAARWALRQWGFKPPTIEPTAQPSSDKAWWYSPMKVTMVQIPAGSVGSQAKSIVVKESFWLSDCEISIELFKQFMAESKDKPDDWPGANTFDNTIDEAHPVQQVSWEDAIMFCNWLSEKHGLDKCYELEPLTQPTIGQTFNVKQLPADGFRLPTAEEWEYACRAKATTVFSSGDDEGRLRDYAVFGAPKTNPSGSKLCNPWGLYDMHGNVYEWCSDADGSVRVSRGGGWSFSARYCQSSYFIRYDASVRHSYIGFRVARDR